MSASVVRHQQTALQRRFAGIIRLQQRVKLRVPILGIVDPTFLKQTKKFSLPKLVGRVKQGMLWLEKCDGRVLARNPRTPPSHFSSHSIRCLTLPTSWGRKILWVGFRSVGS